MNVLISVFIIVFGSALISCSWWLLINSGDRRLLRRVRPTFEVSKSKEQAVASRTLNLAMFSIVMLVIGGTLLVVGIVRLIDGK
jgi:sterol desaturase/sphingolipid hydroxylase (fatty acid hydroxylase superfamily)